MAQNILVIEDDKSMAKLIQFCLEESGYRVQVVHDGKEGLDLGRQNAHDLIVMDVMLPSMNGFDIVRILRSESKVPIIMLSARNTEEDKLLGFKAGADDYITKPFNSQEFVARVRALLRYVRNESTEQSVP